MRGKNPKDAKPARPKILVYGEAGVGKTWTALDFPAAYYIDCEGGASLPHYTDKLSAVGALYMGPEDGANDFGVVLHEVQELATTKHDRKTLIVDSYSKLFGTAIQVENDRLTAKGSKTDFGVDKKPAVSSTRRLITWLDKLDMNVILICHQRKDWEAGEQVGYTYDGWEKLSYELNLTLQVVKQGPSRKARVVKSRFEQFENGQLVPWTYEEFRERFGPILEGESVPLEPASEEQVSKLEKLIDCVNVEPSTCQRWKDKAGVAKWSEMDGATIQKCIDFLASQIPA